MRPFTSISFVLAILAIILARPASVRAQDHAPDDQVHDDHSHHGGFPEFVDVFFTHHAYLERKIHPRISATLAESADDYEESAELAWQFNRWLGGEVTLPIVQSDPDPGDAVGGLGDVELAPMVALWQNPERLTIVTARSGFVLPTGDEDEGLGAGGWTWEPGLLLWKGYGAERRGALQAELTYERLYADEGPDGEDLVYNLAWSYWLPSDWIPIVELNGVTPLQDVAETAHEDDASPDQARLSADRGGLTLAHGDAVEAEDTVISGMLGFRYAFANGQQWGAGLQLPLTDTEAYDWRIVVGGIIHLN